MSLNQAVVVAVVVAHGIFEILQSTTNSRMVVLGVGNDNRLSTGANEGSCYVFVHGDSDGISGVNASHPTFRRVSMACQLSSQSLGAQGLLLRTCQLSDRTQHKSQNVG